MALFSQRRDRTNDDDDDDHVEYIYHIFHFKLGSPDLIRKKRNINQSDTLHIQPFFSTPAHKKVKNFSPFDVLLSRNVSYLFPCKFINTTHQLARGIELI